MKAEVKKARALSFDRVASSYRAAHVGYPEALTNAVVTLAQIPEGGRILEVGSGTGAATLSFAKRGYQMVCLEPGANMVKVAQETLAAYPNVRIHGSTFEDWPLEPGTFDLAFSARALHWVDPSLRFEKAADALRPGGSLAIFKNIQLPCGSPVDLALRPIIERYVPYRQESRMEALEHQFATSPHFNTPIERVFAWSCEREAHVYGVSESIRLEYYDITPQQRSELFSDIEKTINEHGGTIKVEYETHLLIARRRKGGAFWRRLTSARAKRAC